MRIALLSHTREQSKAISAIWNTFASISHVALSRYFVEDKIVQNEQGARLSLQDIIEASDTFLFHPDFPYHIRHNLEAYFSVHGYKHLFGTMSQYVLPYDFLEIQKKEVINSDEDIEHTIARLWGSLLHPVAIQKKNKPYEVARTIHDFRRHALPPLVQGEKLECFFEPKGRKLVCGFGRNIRGKAIYRTPLFEIYDAKNVRLSSLSFPEKESILQKLEPFFAVHGSLWGLTIELIHTSKGMHISSLVPIDTTHIHNVPIPFNSVGISGQDILTSCMAWRQ